MVQRVVGCIVTLTLSLLAAPRAAHAQRPAHVPRIGYLRPNLVSPCRSDAIRPRAPRAGLRGGPHHRHRVALCGRDSRAGAGAGGRTGPAPRGRLSWRGRLMAPWRPCRRRARSPLSLWTWPSRWPWGWSPAWRGRAGTSPAWRSQVGLEFHAKRLQLLLEAVPGVTRVAALQHGAFVRALPARARHAASDGGGGPVAGRPPPDGGGGRARRAGRRLRGDDACGCRGALGVSISVLRHAPAGASWSWRPSTGCRASTNSGRRWWRVASCPITRTRYRHPTARRLPTWIKHPEGHQTRGPARGAAHEVRAGHQPEDRQGARDHDPPDAPVPVRTR